MGNDDGDGDGDNGRWHRRILCLCCCWLGTGCWCANNLSLVLLSLHGMFGVEKARSHKHTLANANYTRYITSHQSAKPVRCCLRFAFSSVVVSLLGIGSICREEKRQAVILKWMKKRRLKLVAGWWCVGVPTKRQRLVHALVLHRSKFK